MLEPKAFSLKDFWPVNEVAEDGTLGAKKCSGWLYSVDGIDTSFFTDQKINQLHNLWRTAFHFEAGEEIQIIYRKRVHFSDWVESQLENSLLSENKYGRQLLLSKLASELSEMSEDLPQVSSQKIIVCYWSPGNSGRQGGNEKRLLMLSALRAMGLNARVLGKEEVLKEINSSAQSLQKSEDLQNEWPHIEIRPGHLKIDGDVFRSVELTKLPEAETHLGMIEAITSLPYPIDLSIRLKIKQTQPVSKSLEKKRNLLASKRGNKDLQKIESQIRQIDEILRILAENSENIVAIQANVGLRMPESLGVFQSRALGHIVQAAAKMNFCEFEESAIGTFDSYLECIPTFRGKNQKLHTVLSSNAIHFLPFFRPSKGDARPVVTFHTRSGSIYSIDPIDPAVANYNWLVSGTSGAGKSFFVNSLIAQSMSLNPNIFIVDIGGSYNKLTKFLGGKVMGFDIDTGFQMGPFFLAKSDNSKEETIRRQHIFQIFLEMIRFDGKSSSVEIRHLLWEKLTDLFEMKELPRRPISYLIDELSGPRSEEEKKLAMLLEPWGKGSFFAQFLDTDASIPLDQDIMTFDLKGLTEFEDLARVVQLIVCATVWARVRDTKRQRFSWLVLDEVAFSLLKTQSMFVDELVSTLRKYYSGVIIIVQDLEKVTSNLAGSSILQNTHSKAILQQRGDPRNYSQILSLTEVDQMAIDSLQREKGSFSEIYLMRDHDRTILRYEPNKLEYWLSTTSPEDISYLESALSKNSGSFQRKLLQFSKEQRSEVR
ncbi:MAG: hypothetical protein COT74_09890 [Bdellovibrionales bacterium CG10_big_fil_rev_8_21_14_0_10_45_34]|nr:MAG: hypothetical protein COT74_09890 [Bdellovibrionales bacterium CG10_big_fil_rev_8_21_14_0_10_45_34]